MSRTRVIKDGEGYDLAKALAARDDFDAVMRMARDMRNSAAIMTLRVGSRVEWDGKYGSLVQGKVTKVNQTTALVTTDEGVRWRCALGLLRTI